MSDPDIARLREQVDQVERGLLRRIDPGVRAMIVAVGVLVLVIAGLLPWVNGASGWEVLSSQGAGGDGRVDVVPRVFAIGVFVFGVLGSVVSLGLRRWALAFGTAMGSGAFTVLGFLSIWSQQTTTSHFAGPGPGAGLIISVLVLLVLTIVWARIVWSRPGGVLGNESEFHQ
jgi:hypothetical protein